MSCIERNRKSYTNSIFLDLGITPSSWVDANFQYVTHNDIGEQKWNGAVLS